MPYLKSNYSDDFFDISPEYGFLPVSLPLEILPDPYTPLQHLLDQMPVVLGENKFGLLNTPNAIAEAVDALPNMIEHVNKEYDIRIIQALFRGYSFLASAYTLEPAFQHYRNTGDYGKARNILPPQIAQPFCEVAEKLDVYPWLDYHYAYSLGNFRKKDHSLGLEWTNLDMCVRFSGQPDEVGFIMLHVDINQHSPDLVGSVYHTLKALNENNQTAATEWLEKNHQTMLQMNARRREMWKASRWQHYNDFRIFIMGVKGNEELFGDGVIYTGVWDEPKQFRGQTGAQDDIIPMEDIFSGVIRYYPQNELTKYLLDLRTYRPTCIQHFFIDLEESVKSIDEKGIIGILYKNKNAEGLCRLLGILEEIYHFRNGHWQFVQKYIMANTPYAKATGGTPITSWLPNQLKSVMFQMEDTIKLIEELNENIGEHGKNIFTTNKQTLEQKRQLLEEQLELVKEQQFSAEKLFELNKNYGLEDEGKK
jgi:indoleamine 2,3-dioxygenase